MSETRGLCKHPTSHFPLIPTTPYSPFSAFLRISNQFLIPSIAITLPTYVHTQALGNAAVVKKVTGDVDDHQEDKEDGDHYADHAGRCHGTALFQGGGVLGAVAWRG